MTSTLLRQALIALLLPLIVEPSKSYYVGCHQMEISFLNENIYSQSMCNTDDNHLIYLIIIHWQNNCIIIINYVLRIY